MHIDERLDFLKNSSWGMLWGNCSDVQIDFGDGYFYIRVERPPLDGLKLLILSVRKEGAEFLLDVQYERGNQPSMRMVILKNNEREIKITFPTRTSYLQRCGDFNGG